MPSSRLMIFHDNLASAAAGVDFGPATAATCPAEIAVAHHRLVPQRPIV
jgi:hypothetical protein